jgi:hypothetical protein
MKGLQEVVYVFICRRNTTSWVPWIFYILVIPLLGRGFRPGIQVFYTVTFQQPLNFAIEVYLCSSLSDMSDCQEICANCVIVRRSITTWSDCQ